MFGVKKHRRFFLNFLTAIIALTAHWVVADDPHATPQELEILPPMCSNRTVMDRIAASGCGGMHHYCWALVWESRGNRSKEKGGRLWYYYEVAISDMHYVLDRSQRSCVMLPTIYMKIGEWQARTGKYIESIGNYRRAINANPKIIMAYSGMSKAFSLQGSQNEAIAILKEGIKANPNAAFLKKRLEKIESASGQEPKTP